MLFALQVSTMRLTDVQRRSLYVALTLCGHTAWLQWWPRPSALRIQCAHVTLGHRFLTAGVR